MLTSGQFDRQLRLVPFQEADHKSVALKVFMAENSRQSGKS
jgi:hypothetical protein